MYIFYYETPIGKLCLRENGTELTHIYFSGAQPPDHIPLQETAILYNANGQLSEYFSGARTHFTIPINPWGTSFMKKVWCCLQEVEYGKTATYKDIAICAGSPKAYRAVGLANHKNPLPIIIPCHRILGSNGKLIGYGGGLEIKTFLLNLEKNKSHEI